MTINVSKVGDDGFSVKIDNGPTIVARKADELEPISTAHLVAMYNKANPKVPVAKFSDRGVAKNRVWVHLPALAGMPFVKPKGADKPVKVAPAKAPSVDKAAPKAQVAPKAKAEPKPKGERSKGFQSRKSGVIFTMKEYCAEKARTMDEIVDHLAKAFPDKKADSMRSTANINVSPRFNNEMGEWTKTKETGKPTLYSYSFKG